MAVSRFCRRLPVVLLCLLPLAAAAQFDAQHTRFEFQVRARWGQRITGEYPRYDGRILVQEDGRHRVQVVLDAGAVQVARSERFTAIARGPRFFDAARYPQIRFESVPYDPQLLVHGGALHGTLTLHGVSRPETFRLEPATCARPARDCDVVASGRVQRGDYGITGLPLLLSQRVEFHLRVRLRGDAP